MKHIISLVIRFIPRKYLQLFSHFFLRIISVFYKGKNVSCPVCHSHFRKFLPYGRKPPRENALCPQCLSLERHRLLWLFLKNETDFFSAPHKLLHIAPELCYIDRFEKLSNLDYITADLESPLAKVKLDVQQMSFNDNHFDIVFCNHVMEHVTDDHQAMREIFRVLKPGGWAIIQSPQDYGMQQTKEDPTIKNPSEREKAFKQRDHLRLYGLDYGQRLSKAGFTVEEIKYAAKLNEQEVQKHCLPADEIIYLCKKFPVS